MNAVLITGAAGFIGSHFVRHWVAAHPDDTVVALDALTYAGTETNLESVRDRITFVAGDIGDATLVMRLLEQYAIGTVVNFAAESHNSLAILDPGRFFRTNVLGTQQLLEACRVVGVGRFHHVSTCEVYGDLALDATEAFTETSPYLPRTPYNASKAGADHAVRAYHETFQLPVTITNCANNYGSHQFPEKLIPLFTTRAIDNGPLPIYASRHNRREWIHVHDHCTAIAMVLAEGTVGQTYHVGTGEEASVEQIADLILDELGRPSSLKTTVPDRPGHDRRYLLDSTKIRQQLGWQPEIGFRDGIRDTVRWYADNRSWWQPLLTRSPVVEEAWTGGVRATLP
ncbi:dTDP-glucose 4,6-dehydratase [Nocardia transvalensis]|uniref:dTDP-glucose 4,6-dehydratase n=1 Tax=Nocardia transvalensis TaxID=37333 RepID=UPI001895DBAA|nr:dTDP-glucose 4,6-dehydratase [Nocardia transvalensis]MBF6328252.1 dTDP-glucose 4,6-dehydratase [Nocardia transvalensis]